MANKIGLRNYKNIENDKVNFGEAESYQKLASHLEMKYREHLQDVYVLVGGVNISLRTSGL